MIGSPDRKLLRCLCLIQGLHRLYCRHAQAVSSQSIHISEGLTLVSRLIGRIGKFSTLIASRSVQLCNGAKAVDRDDHALRDSCSACARRRSVGMTSSGLRNAREPPSQRYASWALSHEEETTIPLPGFPSFH